MALSYNRTYVENQSTGKALEGVVVRVYKNNVLQSVFADESSTPLPTVLTIEDGSAIYYVDGDGVYEEEYIYNGDILDRVKVTIFNPDNYAPGADVDAILGAPAVDGDLGVFTSPLIADNVSTKAAIESLATNLLATGGAANVGTTQAGAGSQLTTVDEKINRTFSAFDKLSTANKAAALAGTITEAAGEAAVQAAIDTLPSIVGGVVKIEDGVKFNLRDLVSPASNRLEMTYRVDDDQTTGLPGTNIASGERVFFLCSSSYPTDPTGGAVNEWRFTAPFHPGVIIDARKDLVALAASGLAPAQSMTNPVRASLNFHDEQLPTFRILYENYENYDPFSGMFMQSFRRQCVLTNVGTSGWGVAPLVNHRVRGSTSGAKGFVKAIDAGTLTVEWFKGAFVVGETLVNETVAATSVNTISGGTEVAEVGCAYIAQAPYTGAWTIGDRPPAVGTEILNVSGNAKLVPTRDATRVQPRTVTKPTLKFGENPEGGSPHEMGIQYDPAESLNRLYVVDTTAETWRGQLVPISAACTFTHSTTVNTNSTNIASISLASGTGVYIFTFTNNLARVGVITFATLDGFSGTSVVGWKAQVTSRTASGCSVEIRDSANALADIPSGAWASLMIIGGDI